MLQKIKYSNSRTVKSGLSIISLAQKLSRDLGFYGFAVLILRVVHNLRD